MKRKTPLQLLAIGAAVMLTTNCGTTKYVVYAPGENLSALTKVTDGEDRYRFANGGDNGRALFVTKIDKRDISSNIYKKDNPTSASMTQKTGGRNANMAPSYCAAKDILVFSGQQEGAFRKDIYLTSATQGNALTQVTNTPDADENFPSISRDGRYIVYEKKSIYSRSDMDTEVWLKDLQNGENTMLANGRMPAFSPDGKSIAFVRYTNDHESTCLWVMDIHGNNPSQLTDAKMGTIWLPCFSPSGKKIVFSCAKRDKSDFDLYVIERNGNNLTQLTINKSFDGDPYWANDGNIYFTSDRGGRNKNFQIWRFKYGPSTPGPIPPVPDPVPDPVTHIVKAGETITQIANQYHTTVRNLVKWNNLGTMTVTPGMKLIVRKAE